MGLRPSSIADRRQFSGYAAVDARVGLGLEPRPWHRIGVAGMPGHARVWFEQAEADLRAAELSASGGANEWACFQAQQAGEKALKALLYGRGIPLILTHSLRRLVRECEIFD